MLTQVKMLYHEDAKQDKIFSILKICVIISDFPGSHRAQGKMELKFKTAKHIAHGNKASLSAPLLSSE